MAIERKRLAGAPLRASVKRRTKTQMQAAKVRKTAGDHALKALEALASLAQTAKSEAVRVSAANSVLDRALGKPVSGSRAPDSDESEAEGRLEVQWLDPGKS